MDLTCESCEVTGEQRAAMEAGIAAMGGPDDTRVVLTSRFVESVRRLTGSATYHSDRGAGQVGAKTLTPRGGPSTIVVPVSVIDEMPPEEIERLLAHEAGHVLIHARHEDFGEQHYEVYPNTWDLSLLYYGSAAIEEARIERDVIDLGYGPSHWCRPEDLSDALMDLNVSVIGATKNPANSDVEHYRDEIFTVLDRTTKFLACLAAGVITGTGPVPMDQLSADSRRDWEDYIAPTWNVRCELYSLVATARNEFTDLNDKNIVSIVLETEFLKSMGYGGSANGFWREGKVELFDERLDRARRQLTAAMEAEEHSAAGRSR